MKGHPKNTHLQFVVYAIKIILSVQSPSGQLSYLKRIDMRVERKILVAVLPKKTLEISIFLIALYSAINVSKY